MTEKLDYKRAFDMIAWMHEFIPLLGIDLPTLDRMTCHYLGALTTSSVPYQCRKKNFASFERYWDLVEALPSYEKYKDSRIYIPWK